MEEYRLIEEDSKDGFEKAINEHLEEGYGLCGNLTVTKFGSSLWYIQGVMKLEPMTILHATQEKL